MEEKNKSFEKYERILSPSKVPLTRENYAEIKEFLYRGESLNEIRKKTGRALSLVGAIRESKSYEGYYMDRRKIANRQYAARHKKTELPQPLVERLVSEEVHSNPESFAQFALPTPILPPESHLRVFLKALDVYVKEEVEIRVKEKLNKLLEEING